MRRSELATRAGVNVQILRYVQTLRYYERRGLLAQPPRSPSGYRAYPPGTGGPVHKTSPSPRVQPRPDKARRAVRWGEDR
ncbi:MerR family DNA-binding transcriptional regulator [Rhodococcus sp. SMB37]|uniref:MerR family DNA-binding transcriptional regulator n=1 Tax=Rhodococcus sp. SMB37 TaxID=2512213 RepID=UPI002410B75F|nr:MerR family DNA-binding transcriptional regulator [Rhodococcus sp. SMB37]